MAVGRNGDLQENYRQASGKGVLGVQAISSIGTLGEAGGAALSGNIGGAAQKGMEFINTWQGIGNSVINAKNTNQALQQQSFGMNGQPAVQGVNMSPQTTSVQQQPVANTQPNVIGNPVNQQAIPNQNAGSQMLAKSGFDLDAGYNPESGTYNDGSGNVVADQKPTFEQQIQNKPITSVNPNLLAKPMAKFGKKLNYFTYSI